MADQAKAANVTTSSSEPSRDHEDLESASPGAVPSRSQKAGSRVRNAAPTLPRRRFLGVAAATAGALLVGSRVQISGQEREGDDDDDRDDRERPDRLHRLPAPGESGIEHVVLVMMENRSFDHFLGWLPHANGRQAGLTYRDQADVAHSTYPLFPDYQGCGHPDPDHSYEGGRVEYNNGA